MRGITTIGKQRVCLVLSIILGAFLAISLYQDYRIFCGNPLEKWKGRYFYDEYIGTEIPWAAFADYEIYDYYLDEKLVVPTSAWPTICEGDVIVKLKKTKDGLMTEWGPGYCTLEEYDGEVKCFEKVK